MFTCVRHNICYVGVYPKLYKFPSNLYLFSIKLFLINILSKANIATMWTNRACVKLVNRINILSKSCP